MTMNGGGTGKPVGHPRRQMVTRIRTAVRVAIAVLLIGVLVAAALLLPAREAVQTLIDSAPRGGPIAIAAFAAAYAVATVLFVPGTLLTLASGFALGLVNGTIAVSLGSTLGATAAFVLGRTLLRDVVGRWVEARPAVRSIDRAVGQRGFRTVLLIRLSPVFPFNLTNYALGLTRVRTLDYVLASWLGMLPATVLYVYLGTLAKDAASLATGKAETGPWRVALLAVGLVATVAVVFMLTKAARTILQAEQDKQTMSDEG